MEKEKGKDAEPAGAAGAANSKVGTPSNGAGVGAGAPRRALLAHPVGRSLRRRRACEARAEAREARAELAPKENGAPELAGAVAGLAPKANAEISLSASAMGSECGPQPRAGK